MRPDQARAVLGVSTEADRATIKRRYHLLARDWHPDAGGDPDQFQQIQQAYDLLLRVGPTASATPARPDRAAARRAAADRARQEREKVEPIDLDRIDWTRPLPSSATALDHELLAVVAGSLAPIAPLVAVSRGPKGILNRFSHALDDAMTVRLEVGIRLDDGELGAKFLAQNGKGRAKLLELRGLHHWSVNRLSQDIVFATRPLPIGTYAQVNGLRAADAVGEALDRMSWPMDRWRLLEPLAT